MDNPWVSQPLAVAAEFVEMPFGGDPTDPGPFSLGDAGRLESVLSNAGLADLEVSPLMTPVRVGSDPADAAEFLSKLMGPVATLEAEDPERYAQFRSRVVEEISEWDGPDGVLAPSASWIVTARR